MLCVLPFPTVCLCSPADIALGRPERLSSVALRPIVSNGLPIRIAVAALSAPPPRPMPYRGGLVNGTGRWNHRRSSLPGIWDGGPAVPSTGSQKSRTAVYLTAVRSDRARLQLRPLTQRGFTRRPALSALRHRLPYLQLFFNTISGIFWRKLSIKIMQFVQPLPFRVIFHFSLYNDQILRYHLLNSF